MKTTSQGSVGPSLAGRMEDRPGKRRHNPLTLIAVLAVSLVVLSAARSTAASPAAGLGEQTFLPFMQSNAGVTFSPGGIWLSAPEIAALPTNGPAWQNILSWANESATSPNVGDRIDQTDAVVVAKALVYVRTGQNQYRNQVVDALNKVIGTENEDMLALARNLAGYAVAADIVGFHGPEAQPFSQWLDMVRFKVIDDWTLSDVHNRRPNNWGTHAGVSRIAAALYLGDMDELEQAAAVFHGWVGNRAAYASFNFGSDLSWQCNPSQPVAVNPAGCTIQGSNVDGVLPDDQRRGGSFSWPPPKENYAWEALQGAVAQAWMLERAGYPAFSWENQALLRAVTWLYEEANFPATGDDSGTPWFINGVYGTNFSTVKANPGKNGLGFYDWYFSN